MSRPKILMINPFIRNVAVDILKNHAELIEIVDSTRKSILEKVNGVDAIFWATKERLDTEILDRAGPQLKVVGCVSAGTNHLDLNEMKKRNIKCSHAPGVQNNVVADMAVLLALAASRRLHEGRLSIENGQWHPGLQTMLGVDISGSTVGIVGLGGIGQSVVKRLKAFEASTFLYTGPSQKPEEETLGAQYVPLDKLLNQSDFVIVSCPLNNSTRHLFNDTTFAKMKKTAIFVNVSRGEVVDQKALYKALKERKIFAAGLDVMTPEPLPVDHELLQLPNCVLMPHAGAATEKARDTVLILTAKNILRALKGEEMLTPAY